MSAICHVIKKVAILFTVSLLLLSFSGCNSKITYNDDSTNSKPEEIIAMNRLIEYYKDYTNLFSDVRNNLIRLNSPLTIYRNKKGEIVFECKNASVETQVKNNADLMDSIIQILDSEYINAIVCAEDVDKGNYLVVYGMETIFSGKLSTIEFGENLDTGEKKLINNNWFYVEMIGE